MSGKREIVMNSSLLSKLIEIPSTDRSGNHMLVEYLSDWVRRNITGFKLERQVTNSGFENLLVYFGEPKMVIVAHTDVVGTEGQVWKTNPYKLNNSGDWWIGRGSADNKGSIASVLGAVKEVRPNNILLAFTSDEETGLEGIKTLSNSLPNSVGHAIVCEPTGKKLVTSHRGVAGINIRFFGKSSHAAYPQLGESAIEKAARFVCDVLETKDEDAVINFGVIRGGEKLNVVAGECLVRVNYRYFKKNAQIWLKHVGAVNHTSKVSVEVQFDLPPFHSSFKEDELLRIKRIAKAVDVGAENFYSEAGLLSQKGVDTVVYGTAPISRAHTEGEYVTTSELMDYQEFFIKLFKLRR